jgi:hypothetical protein
VNGDGDGRDDVDRCSSSAKRPFTIGDASDVSLGDADRGRRRRNRRIELRTLQLDEMIE